MRTLALSLFCLISSPLWAGYRIQLKGGGSYWSPGSPQLKNGTYTFRTADGTLFALRKGDVASVREEAPPPAATEGVSLGPSSPATAARPSSLGRLDSGRRRRSDLEKNDAYKLGRAVAEPSASDQYEVGRTLAPPASGRVLTGPPPKMETPPPPQ